MRLILVCSALLLIIVLTASAIELWPRSHTGTAAPAPRVDETEIARLRREVLALQAESASLRRLARRVEASGGGDVGPAPAAADAPPAPESADTSFESYWSMLDHHFSAEPVDPGWQAHEELGRKLAEAMPRASRVRSLECRRTMCRLETAHGDDQGYKEFAKLFAMHPDVRPVWTGPAVYRILHTPDRPGDELVAVALLARESFPPLDGEPDTSFPTKETSE